jgi:hypothetical protein
MSLNKISFRKLKNIFNDQNLNYLSSDYVMDLLDNDSNVKINLNYKGNRDGGFVTLG